MKQINVRNLVKSYRKGENAVDDISFLAEGGSLTTLLGPSGCGKTTTLRCIAGLETPQGGEIGMGSQTLFSGKSGVNMPSENRNVGMVFQNYALWPHMTVSENISFGLRLRRWPRQRISERIREVLEMLRLSGRENDMPGQLSGGQQQRVALGRALAYDPEVLLLDEPLANLDARLREEMRFEIRRIQESTGVTAICVTHDQSEAMVLSDKIIVMHNGRIEQEGTPREIYERPRTEFTASFIGLSNILDVDAVTGEGDMFRGTTPVGELRFNINGMQPDEVRKLSIRPEDIGVSTTAKGAVNEIEMTVQSLLFQGESVVLFTARGESRIRVHVTRNFDSQAGDTVHLTLPPESLVVLR